MTPMNFDRPEPPYAPNEVEAEGLLFSGMPAWVVWNSERKAI